MSSVHSAWHLCVTSLFVIQQCGVVSFCFGGYKIAKERGYPSKEWLLYSGIMSSIFLLIGVIDLALGIMSLNFGFRASTYIGSLVFLIGIPIVMTVMTGLQMGKTYLSYSDLTTEDAKKDVDSVKKWLQYGVGIGVTVPYLLSLFVFFMGSGHDYAARAQGWFGQRFG